MKNVEFGRQNNVVISILLISIISAITFLPFINQLGFYGDDWVMLWGYMTSGSEKVESIFSIDRPFPGIIMGQEFNVIGINPLNWQIFNFFMHLIGSLLFFWLVRLLWQDQKIPTLLMALIYSTYPGFLQNPQAITYQTFYLGVNLGLFSIILEIYAIRTKQKKYKLIFSILSFVIFVCCLLILEWLIGILAIYIVLIFYELKKKEKTTSLLRLKTFYYSIPALLGSIVFLIWRVFIFQNRRYATDIDQVFANYENQTLSAIFSFLFRTWTSFYKTTIVPWFVCFNDQWEFGPKKIIFEGLVIAFMAVLFIGIFLYRQTKKREKKLDSPGDWARDGIVIGLIGTIFTILPVTFTGRYVASMGTFNRYTLNSIAWVSIFVISLMYYLIKDKNFIYCFSAILLFLSIFTHIQNKYNYKEKYQNQKEFWWQLSWRAPDIKNKTVVIPYGLDFIDNSHAFSQVNLIYRPNSKNVEIATQILNVNPLKTLKEILVSKKVNDANIRDISFQQDYQNILVVSVTNNSCLRVWDESQATLAINHNPSISIIAPLSKVTAINTKSIEHLPPENIFGKEPTHSWCYYYQKASLAQQDQDWNTVVLLGKELNAKKLHPLDVSEWMPFFEGYANISQYEEAKGIALRMKSDMVTVNLICKSFSEKKPVWYENTDDDVYQFMKQALCG